MPVQMRTDYPRPQFVRNAWVNLNGEWEFAFDDEGVGEQEGWYRPDNTAPFDRRIQVPFAFQSKLSGIGENGFHDIVWYRRTVSFSDEFVGKRVLLHFGAVDYLASIWVNGTLVKTHEGGHTPFFADIADALIPDGDNVIIVRAEDYSRDLTLPRGKQYWEENSASIFYTRTTGIWQTVWAEAVHETHLDKVMLTPDIDRNEIEIRSFVRGFMHGADVRLKVHITYEEECVAEDIYGIHSMEESRCIHLNDNGKKRWWSPEQPHLYNVQFTLLVDGIAVDEASSYFGMRKISIENGKLCLNNRPYFLKMVLDQGYFPDGVLTPPSDEALKHDVELTKAMGFNGARKHQKIEDPRYLYWCDQLGLIVWGEMANAYEYSERYVRRMTMEWQEAIERDYNHPSIIAWVPLNESWGVPNVQIDAKQQNHALAMYHLTKSLDATRLVISNDGWEQLKTDLCTIHDYAWNEKTLTERYSSVENAVSAMPAKRRIYVGGYVYDGAPILLTEFGGIAYRKSGQEGWGYSSAKDDDDYLQRLRAVVAPLYASPVVQGFCYTQLTDVEQEINGLLTYDREPKVPLEKIREIIEGK